MPYHHWLPYMPSCLQYTSGVSPYRPKLVCTSMEWNWVASLKVLSIELHSKEHRMLSHTDPITNRPCPYQHTSTQDMKKRYAKLPTSYLQRNNRRQTSSTVHLSMLHTQKISTYTKNWEKHFQLKQATRWWEDHPPHTQLPQQDWMIQTHLWRYQTQTGEIKESLVQCALP